ncbi:NAD(P)H-dependent oxidoreductase [Lacticaseibacillus chiayiensis]|uniref:NAD(P)H-dependent oxidoreductase n=1 Tax=Lacticaseibacillus chiayiensis TaxID=2100821 RepID=UPI003C7842BD
MKTLVVVSHPNIEKSDTQQFLKASAASLSQVVWHHLDANLPFDVAAEQQMIQKADRIIFQFPLYWYMAPASLHQWLTEVWVKQFVYNAHGGLLTGKSLGIVVSFSQPESAYQLGGCVGFSVSQFLAPYAALAEKTGLELLAPLTIARFANQNDTEHQQLLIRYQQYLTLTHPDNAEEQAQWFIDRLQADPDTKIMADELAAQTDEIGRLRLTLHELKAGESE